MSLKVNSNNKQPILHIYKGLNACGRTCSGIAVGGGYMSKVQFMVKYYYNYNYYTSPLVCLH